MARGYNDIFHTDWDWPMILPEGTGFIPVPSPSPSPSPSITPFPSPSPFASPSPSPFPSPSPVASPSPSPVASPSPSPFVSPSPFISPSPSASPDITTKCAPCSTLTGGTCNDSEPVLIAQLVDLAACTGCTDLPIAMDMELVGSCVDANPTIEWTRTYIVNGCTWRTTLTYIKASTRYELEVYQNSGGGEELIWAGCRISTSPNGLYERDCDAVICNAGNEAVRFVRVQPCSVTVDPNLWYCVLEIDWLNDPACSGNPDVALLGICLKGNDINDRGGLCSCVGSGSQQSRKILLAGPTPSPSWVACAFFCGSGSSGPPINPDAFYCVTTETYTADGCAVLSSVSEPFCKLGQDIIDDFVTWNTCGGFGNKFKQQYVDGPFFALNDCLVACTADPSPTPVSSKYILCETPVPSPSPSPVPSGGKVVACVDPVCDGNQFVSAPNWFTEAEAEAAAIANCGTDCSTDWNCGTYVTVDYGGIWGYICCCDNVSPTLECFPQCNPALDESYTVNVSNDAPDDGSYVLNYISDIPGRGGCGWYASGVPGPFGPGELAIQDGAFGWEIHWNDGGGWSLGYAEKNYGGDFCGSITGVYTADTVGSNWSVS